ncbi:hypothetical protein M2139_000962 [Enterococcus sp. PF1-24]|uniref:hypothetical protein n=1 Tax=unclassified Enterococcus TaxID=2608891 RepID=UPI0024741DFB|nr:MULTISPECIES: hypothetical protein [unclassified Enterococcus]MDH6363977.1 hypothetical protein [Enterococcus sp. PFB1-1]MDH6401078.1 hypothetical protein [Enterococcus sp. PF1-24]
MTNISLAILDKTGQVKLGKNDYEEERRLLQIVGEDFVDLATQEFYYEDGDVIRIEVEKKDVYLVAKLDETLDTTLIYLKDHVWEYKVDMTENAREARPEQRFASKRHYLSVRVATTVEAEMYRNLAFNPHDQKESNGAYPHAFANVETRNDATFFACNAIDGVYGNLSHGSYPYQSWGINQQSNAALTVDFGREVALDKVIFTFRADFPHDNYWEEVCLTFSDGSKESFATVKTARSQTFSFEKRTTSSVVFSHLKQAEDPSPFPALTEIELFGNNILE